MDDSLLRSRFPPSTQTGRSAALLGALELRHPGTCRHAERVAEIALDLTAVVRPELAATEGIGRAYLPLPLATRARRRRLPS